MGRVPPHYCIAGRLGRGESKKRAWGRRVHQNTHVAVFNLDLASLGCNEVRPELKVVLLAAAVQLDCLVAGGGGKAWLGLRGREMGKENNVPNAPASNPNA